MQQACAVEVYAAAFGCHVSQMGWLFVTAVACMCTLRVMLLLPQSSLRLQRLKPQQRRKRCAFAYALRRMYVIHVALALPSMWNDLKQPNARTCCVH